MVEYIYGWVKGGNLRKMRRSNIMIDSFLDNLQIYLNIFVKGESG